MKWRKDIFCFLFPTGIVYVFSQKDAEVVSTELQQSGILAQAYHASMEPSDRTLVHRQWSSKKIQVQPLIPWRWGEALAKWELGMKQE